MEALLRVENLTVRFRREGVVTTPVRGVSLSVGAGERVAVVGESGCGKSMTMLALTGLAPTDHAERGGQAWFRGQDLLALAPEDVRALRGRDGLAYIFQDPTGSLNQIGRAHV